MFLKIYRKRWIDCVYIPTVMGNIKRETKPLKKNQMKILELENTIAEVKNVLRARMDTTEESISELENRSIETNQTETWRE